MNTSLKNQANDCTFAFAWAGYLDWIRERMYGAAPGETPALEPSQKGMTLLWSVLLIAVLLLLASFVVPLLAPTLVSGMTAMGPANVANTSIGLSMLLVFAFAVVWPVMLGRRFFRFAHQCCQRGRELGSGIRKPVAVS